MKSPKLLKGKRFEQKPKIVRQAPDYRDHCGVHYHARLKNELHEILDCLHNGWAIPERYYPGGIDARGDRLLSEIGVKHLHLDGQGSDIIVYLAEFEDWVELIEINTHVHLESEPRGESLTGRFRVATAVVASAGAAVGAAVAGKVGHKRRRRKKKGPPSRATPVVDPSSGER